MDQGHVLEGLLSGDKVQKASLAAQIGCVDFQLFRHAVHCASKQTESSSKNLLANSSLSRKKVIKIPYKSFINLGEKSEPAFSRELKEGLETLVKSKAAFVLVRNGSDSDAEFLSLLSSFSELMKVIENRVSPPFVIVSQPGHVESVTNWLIESNYFGLDAQKVWVLEELELPIVSMSSEAKFWTPSTKWVYSIYRYAAHPTGQSLGILCYLALSLPVVLMLASSSPRPVNREIIST